MKGSKVKLEGKFVAGVVSMQSKRLHKNFVEAVLLIDVRR
jgi:hypothetical protein